MTELCDAAFPARDDSPGQRTRAGERRSQAAIGRHSERPGGPRPTGRTRMTAPNSSLILSGDTTPALRVRQGDQAGPSHRCALDAMSPQAWYLGCLCCDDAGEQRDAGSRFGHIHPVPLSGVVMGVYHRKQHPVMATGFLKMIQFGLDAFFTGPNWPRFRILERNVHMTQRQTTCYCQHSARRR